MQKRFLLTNFRFLAVLSVVAVVVKVVLSGSSVVSYDFLYLLRELMHGWRQSPVPYVQISGPFYDLWRALPFDHPDLTGLIAGDLSSIEPRIYALALMIKMPVLVADLICAYLVKSIVVQGWGKQYGMLAATCWLLNPYVLITGEMT